MTALPPAPDSSGSSGGAGTPNGAGTPDGPAGLEPQGEVRPPVERPIPAYGELAPEGWEWKPETEDGGSASVGAPQPSERAGAGVPAGVPHNLGVTSGGTAHPTAQATSQRPGSGDPEPYRAAPPQQPRQDQQANFGGPGSTAPQFAGARPRTADRVITIILLALGAIGSLQLAGSLMNISTSFSLVGSALDLEDFTVPSWVGTAGTISAIAIIALYAVNLIFSIQRMRARKLAFWVPLVAGAIAVIGTIVVTTVLMLNVPDLMQAASDPSSTGKLLDYFEEMSRP
ncbi:DUF6264 family protein [Leucobacter sp. USHLN153]|uniref:DUF6264 family protein n=1 Tax=Leucobacter sp. USHLN153 TaxID=3081268 RepID=UPI00301A1257